MVQALLIFGAGSVGFGGHPWIAFVGGALLLMAYSVPERLEAVWRYRHEPKADVVIGTFSAMALSLVGAFGGAWAGYGLRLILRFLLGAQ